MIATIPYSENVYTGAESLVGTEVIEDITSLVDAANDGEAGALRALFTRLYDELKLLARKQLADSAGNTLNTTGLVHEAYLKLAHPATRNLHSRRHFFALAAKAMRQIVIDHARARLTEKRGGPALCAVALDDALDIASPDLASDELLRLDLALTRMASEQPQLAELVELRFFAGLEVAEIAAIQSLSERTVVRNWRRAKVMLYGDLHPDE